MGAAIGAEVDGEQAVGVPGLEHHRAGTVGEEHGGGPVVGVGEARHAVGADEQDPTCRRGIDRPVRHHQRIDELEHAALMLKAPPDKPSAWCTAAEVAGTARSGVQVARTRRSTSVGDRAARSRARRPASVASDDTVPPMRRSRIPERVAIHSSVVSRRASRSALVTTVSGKALPQPVITAPVVTD